MVGRTLGVVVLLLTGVTAQASVVYQWQSLANSDDIQITNGELIVTDAAYRAGNIDVSYDIDSNSVPNNAGFPGSPIEKASLQIAVSPRFERDIFVYPRVGFGDATTSNPSTYDLSADLQTSDDGQTGTLSLLAFDSSFTISASDPDLWTLDQFASDQLRDENCGSQDQRACPEVTGRWTRVAATDSDVSAPSAWLLFGLSIAGMIAVRRLSRAGGAG